MAHTYEVSNVYIKYLYLLLTMVSTDLYTYRFQSIVRPFKNGVFDHSKFAAELVIERDLVRDMHHSIYFNLCPTINAELTCYNGTSSSVEYLPLTNTFREKRCSDGSSRDWNNTTSHKCGLATFQATYMGVSGDEWALDKS